MRISWARKAQLSSDRSHSDLITQWFDTTRFIPNAPGTFGNSGNNNFLGPYFFNMDLGLLKSTRLIERVTLQFRAEFFNIFNNVNFNNPGTVVSIGKFVRAYHLGGKPPDPAIRRQAHVLRS